jgi:hypothetical protein
MGSPVIVATMWSAPEAEMLADHLRRQGIAAVARTHLPSPAYAGVGGATVLVAEDQVLEAELELVLLAELAAGPQLEEPETGRTRVWVRLSAWVVVTALGVGVIVPSAIAVWQRVLG